MTEGEPYTDARGNARFVELQNKSGDDWTPQTDDGRYGWIVYGEKMSEGNFDGELEVKGMEANSWYLVTLWSNDADSETASNLGSVGYYGKDPKTQHTDIALFQTSENGEAEIRLPYTSPALDPTWEALVAPTLPEGDYNDVEVHVKYVGTGNTPDWSMVLYGGYTDTDGQQEHNLYSMAYLDFEIWGTPQHTTVLVKKDYTDPAWPLDYNGLMDTYGELRYRIAGEEFAFEFTGHQLEGETDYSLIYYADPWPGNNPGALIATGTTDEDGYLYLEDEVELNMDLPHEDDANYGTGAKLWLVPSADYNATTNAMEAWNPGDYLFEYNLINYDDTDV
ncbi:MAG: hypothetical protein ACP5FL_03320 [Thermoplasmatota archaeon]